ncbi:MAG: O-antigen ligase family protein [Hyphomicrobiales bacterium]|nr:O-antigen ligase family protein [Hyphomicrobiales bacterium]
MTDARARRAALACAAAAAVTAPVAVITVKAVVPIVLAMALAVLVFGGRRLRLPGGPGLAIAAAVALGLAWGAVSALASPVAAQWWTTAAKVAGLTATGLVLVAGVRTLDGDGRALVGWALVGGVVVALALLAVEVLTGSALNIAARPSSWGTFDTMPHHVRMSLLKSGAAVTAILLWPAAGFLRHRAGPWAAAALVAAGIAVLALAGGLAAKLSWVVGAVVLLAALVRPRAAAAAVAAALALFLAVAPLVPNGYLVPALTSGQITFLPYSAFHRIFIWGFTAERIAERPVMGWGLNASKQFGGHTKPIRHEIPLEGRPDWANESEPIPLHPHNATLQIWLELGLPGTVLAAVVLGATLLAIAGLGGPPGRRAFALATFAAALVVAEVSYGIWQNWWLAMLWLTAALTLAAADSAGEDGT